VNASLTRAWRFGPFRLLPEQQALFEGDREVRLGSRAFEILRVLVERAGTLVTKDQLIAAVWSDVFVEESTLRVHIAALRKALGDGPGGVRYIVNVTGRGYRFVAPIALEQALEAPRLIALATGETHGQLPVLRTRVIGRDDIIDELSALLPHRRFLSIVGPGGIGKTTVAIALAEKLAPAYRHGVRFIDLGSLAEAHRVVSTVASGLDLQTLSPTPATELIAFLRDRETLLVLDTCEHLVDPVARLAETVFASAPGVHMLATSREPLRATGEWVYRVPSLGLPAAATGPLTGADALSFPAIQLFAERATASLETFILNDANASVVADICHRLDGNPLAIEIAAARVDFFGIAGLAGRLGNWLPVLSAGRRTAVPRHQTLRGMLDWSYELLTSSEQAILRRLAIFRRSFTLEAAAAIAGSDSLEGIANLAAKSLIAVDVSADIVRYRLLDITRAYAGDKLAESEDAPDIARRHATYCLTLMADAERRWENQTKAAWLDTYGVWIPEVRGALNWAFGPNGDVAVGIALAAASTPLWFALSLVHEFCEWAERALGSIGQAPQIEPEHEMKLNVSLGAAIFNVNGPLPRIAEASARALKIAERLGATTYQLRALWGLARERYVNGDYKTSVEFDEEFGRVARRAGDQAAGLVYDRMSALGYHLLGRHAEARVYAERALVHPAAAIRTAHKAFNEYDTRVASRSHLSRILFVQGYPDRAAAIADEGVEIARTLGYPPPLCYVLVWAACPIAFWRGDTVAAKHYVGLLLEQAHESFGYWQSWRRCYEHAVMLTDAATDPEFGQRITAIRDAGRGPVYLDLLGTLHEALVGPETIARAESGQAEWCAAEILRAQGVALLKQGGDVSAARAEALLIQSLDVSRRQEARAWELRTSISLAELWQRRGKTDAARTLLASAYGWFGEGFATADLTRAAVLLKDMHG
jgi:predicted ATPase/DNA-binding winged helix-turn-helix (wHTH) protein